jgi:membrane protein required for colicin V production
MVWIDLVLLAIVALSALVGWVRGLITEVVSILAWVVASITSLLVSPQLAEYLATWISQPALAYGLSFLVIFVVVLMVASLLKVLVKQLVHKTLLKLPDRVFGLAFGSFRGLMLLVILVMLGSLSPLSQTQNWQQSVLVPQVLSMVDWAQSYLPQILPQANSFGSQINILER